MSALDLDTTNTHITAIKQEASELEVPEGVEQLATNKKMLNAIREYRKAAKVLMENAQGVVGETGVGGDDFNEVGLKAEAVLTSLESIYTRIMESRRHTPARSRRSRRPHTTIRGRSNITRPNSSNAYIPIRNNMQNAGRKNKRKTRKHKSHKKRH